MPGSTDVPWFIEDLKPEGYLGKAWVRRHPRLGLPSDLARWTGDDLLRFVCMHGVDLPGALLVGAHARAFFLDGRLGGRTVEASDSPTALPELAEDEASHGGGSSAGGEQPKVSFRRRHADGSITHHLAKFSPPIDQAAGRRWADLLVAEHLALETLRDLGFEVSRSQVIDQGTRCFLVVERFDRHGDRGRTGLTSLHPFDLGGVGGDLRSWATVTQRLVSEGRLSAADHVQVTRLEAFGHAIANTDMHLGNLALRLDGLRITGLAPVYDMLPMHFAPGPGGEVRDNPFDPWVRLNELPEDLRRAAQGFWARVAMDARVSKGFRMIAREQQSVLRSSPT